MAMTYAGQCCKVLQRKMTCSIPCLKPLSEGVRISGLNVMEKNQTVRFACTRCSRCTKEIEARKLDGNGGSVYSETDAEKKWFWRWLFAQILKVESLQHCTVNRDTFTLAAAPPPPPLPQQAIQNLVPDIVAPSETVVEVPSQTETVVEVSSENLLEASIVEPLVPDDIVEVQPVFEAAPTSSLEGDNGWTTDL